MGKLPSLLAYAHFSRRVGGEGACFHGSSRHGKRELRIPPIYRATTIVVARVRAVETDYQKLDRTYLRLLEQLDLLREDPS